ncbi:hypothetical protein I2W78_22390 [Streptomyces spinoverrucosus]|uniref:hypothetical protein n=1 Tax=Streptomyces spinoverrucosus TaxID=284043 RepID=UPI0018C3C25A|nr:hypothetical protein [Streptomyces spinoverrucosus]MBG0854515.1 hypothetical protein [Streptomyces spinoverrucosus]
MASTDGYQIKKSGMSGQAKELDGAGDDMGKVRVAVAPTTCYVSDVLGGTDAATAVNAFIAAWAAEARTLESALHELADKVHLAKGAYTGSDGLVATGVDGIAVSESRVSTMPVYAERPSVLSSY